MEKFRQLILLSILIIGALNTYSLLEIIVKSNHLFTDLDSTLIYFTFCSIITSLTFLPSLVFNYKLTYPKKQYKETNIIDSNSFPQKNDLLRIGNRIFGIALASQCLFILTKSLLFNEGDVEIKANLIEYIIIILVLILGIVITLDSKKRI